jgi:hypothetical protein
MGYLMPFKLLKLWGLLTVLLTVMLMNNAEAVAQNAESSKQPASEGKKEQPPPGLAELVHMASKKWKIFVTAFTN